jgi:hypothetical protein
MNQTNEKANKYLAVNSVGKSIIPSFPDKKRQTSSKVSNKELAEGSFRWDPNVRQFVRVIR